MHWIGIDGLIYFKPDGKKTERAIVSVKGGDNVSVAVIRDLRGVLDREKAPLGIFLSLTEPAKPMIAEAASAGIDDTGYGKRPHIPFGHTEGFKKAAEEQSATQGTVL